MKSAGGEFHIIREYFERHAQYDDSVALGIGDDCALIIPTPNTQQAISVDTSIAGRHFPEDANPFDIAYRSLNVSLSDLAAMGARPRWFTLALSLPSINIDWLAGFSKGLFQAASNAGVQLIGGDTTKGALSITIQVQGELPVGEALKRSGAKLGDTIYVSRSLGDAGAGLAIYQKKMPVNEQLLTAYLRPEPELVLGQQLISKANSAIDISDGLLADLGHIASASKVAAEVDIEKIPISPALLSLFDKNAAISLALSAGDDYCLCFTSPLTLEELALDNVYAIGRIVSGEGVHLINMPEGLQLTQTGFDHFNE